MNGGATVTIRQVLPTRVRLAAPRLSWHRDACERVARALSPAEGMGSWDRVTVRPATGSVILEGRDVAPAAPALREKLEALLRDEHDEEGRRLVDLGVAHHPGPTRIARAVVHAVAGINADVRAALDERADLGTLLPVVFAVAGIAEVGATGEMPGPTWFNLLWWSMRSFMTFNLSAQDEEEEAQRPDGADEMRVGGAARVI
jgi:hypothetical protein